MISCQPTTSVLSCQPTDSLFTCQPTDSLFTCQPTDSLFTCQPTDSLFTFQPTDSLFTCQPTDSLFTCQPTDSLTPIFCVFRCFVFSPDVPIRLDYHGRYGRDMGQVGTLSIPYSAVCTCGYCTEYCVNLYLYLTERYNQRGTESLTTEERLKLRNCGQLFVI